jgi:2-desacetyl-2-hydroxyethyl bacteriochlorophyllide A dehydrogenase
MTTLDARYAVFSQKNTVTFQTESLPASDLHPDALLIETEATVISAGTEVATLTGDDPTVTYPVRPGYGNVGRVIARGARVSEFAVGERVFSFGKHTTHSLMTPPNNPIFEGVFPMDDSIPLYDAVMLRMGLIAFAAPQLTDFEAGDTVAVFGLGLVGNLAAQLYKLAGARVIALDPMPERCELARKSGIETVLNVAPAQQVEAIRDLTGGKGATVTVDAAGFSASVINAVAACADYGQIISLGSPRTPYQTDVTETLRHIHLRWLTLRGALEWRLPPQPVTGGGHSIKSNLARLVDFYKSGQLNIRPLISQIVKPEQLPDAYLNLQHHKASWWGVVIDWRKEG